MIERVDRMLRKKIFIVQVIAMALSFSSVLAITPTPIVVEINIEGIRPPQGPSGTKVYIWGGGATPNGTVVALFETSTIVNITSEILVTEAESNITVGWTIANKDGTWDVGFDVPSVSPGTHKVYAVDNGSLTSDSTIFVVTATMIRIDYVFPQSGPVGTSVSISGSGATPYGEVGVYFDEINLANTTAKEGWWSAYFTVPEVDPGNHTITALDVTTNMADTAFFTVTPPPTIQVSPSEAPIGSKITISGEGFPTRTGVFVSFEDLLLFAPVTTDEKGEFNVTLFVPMVNSGTYIIKATTMYPYYQSIANASFTVTLGIETLFSKLAYLNSSYHELNNSYDRLLSDYNQYKEIHTHSDSEYENLLNEYNQLNASHDSMNSTYQAIRSDLETTRNLNYVFIIITTIFIATTAYFVVRKPKIKTS